MEDNIKSSGDCQQAEGTGVIYKITNTLNGKSYVGQTRQSLEMRMRQHRVSKKNSAIDAAIAKYGWENFTVEVLETCPVSKLNEREIFFIAALNTKAPNGYNLTDGGDGGGSNPSEETRAKISANHADVSGKNNPFYGKHHTEETCAKMSLAKKGKSHKPHSKATRDKIAKSNKGKHSHGKGKHLSAEHRAKISVAQKAYRARKKALETRGDS